MRLQLFVNRGEVGFGPALTWRPRHTSAEQALFELSLVTGRRQGPWQASGLGPLQVAVDGAPRDRAAAGDPALPESQLVMETENFFDLALGKLGWGTTFSSTHQWRASRRPIAQRRTLPCGESPARSLYGVAGGLLNPIPKTPDP